MNARFRFLAALLALFAVSASFAEPAWGAACVPLAEAPAGHGDHGAPPPPDQPVPDADGGCPVQAVASACALVPLPAPSGMVAVPLRAPTTLVPPRADPSRELLLAIAFFRPPQS